ncbi:GLPGLI family protein [Polaribacter sp. IC073]|uniref:GLPGLI family protein n=1 Tax=Polaribacter sp. IC073 TaxID=2508540 RepID=UPI0011BE39A5|nr:GLPGLI family protein [Polaribacter sp. IC073]TXD46393.1 GLPGLI family protein [Polaribacter sp. IC073]
MKLIITITLLLFVLSLVAQDFQGKATYKTHRKNSFKIKSINGSSSNDKFQKEMEEKMKKMFQKTYTLNFTKQESIYKQEATLKTPQPQAGGINVLSFGGGGNNSILYKNSKEKTYVHQTDIMGKAFLIKDKLKQLDWELTSETKNIGIYTCYKAVYSVAVDKVRMKMVNNELKQTKEKVNKTTTAWFTMQIPVSNGPDSFGGLPGLILEINDGSLTIVCTEVILNPKEKIFIEIPKKGKKVNQRKFDEIQEEKSKEMMERFRSKRGTSKGNTIEINFGG